MRICILDSFTVDDEASFLLLCSTGWMIKCCGYGAFGAVCQPFELQSNRLSEGLAKRCHTKEECVWKSEIYCIVRTYIEQDEMLGSQDLRCWLQRC